MCKRLMLSIFMPGLFLLDGFCFGNDIATNGTSFFPSNTVVHARSLVRKFCQTELSDQAADRRNTGITIDAQGDEIVVSGLDPIADDFTVAGFRFDALEEAVGTYSVFGRKMLWFRYSQPRNLGTNSAGHSSLPKTGFRPFSVYYDIATGRVAEFPPGVISSYPPQRRSFAPAAPDETTPVGKRDVLGK